MLGTAPELTAHFWAILVWFPKCGTEEKVMCHGQYVDVSVGGKFSETKYRQNICIFIICPVKLILFPKNE